MSVSKELGAAFLCLRNKRASLNPLRVSGTDSPAVFNGLVRLQNSQRFPEK